MLITVFFPQRVLRQSSSSPSSEDSIVADDVDIIEDIRVTDSGVESEQASTSTNSTLEDIRRDEAISVLAEESSEDSSSVCSTENIEKEIVGKLKNMFELQINDSKEKQSTFLNWKKDNLSLKGKETFPKLNGENIRSNNQNKQETNESSDSESSDSTVEIQSKDSEYTRKLEYDLMVSKANESEKCSRSISSDIPDSEYEMKKNIGRESVNRLKGVYENLASRTKKNNVSSCNALS